MGEIVKISQGSLTAAASVSKNRNRFRGNDFTAPEGSLLMPPAFIRRRWARFPLDSLRSSERNQMHLIVGSNEAHGDYEQVNQFVMRKILSTLSAAGRSKWQNHPTTIHFFKTDAN